METPHARSARLRVVQGALPEPARLEVRAVHGEWLLFSWYAHRDAEFVRAVTRAEIDPESDRISHVWNYFFTPDELQREGPAPRGGRAGLDFLKTRLHLHVGASAVRGGDGFETGEGAMEKISFVFTVCFVLIGPVKILPAFARLTREDEPGYRRRVAVWAILVASAICLSIVGLGAGLVARYELSLEALHLGGGLVLLLSALSAIFPRPEPKPEQREKPKAYQLAISPVATPLIVTPAGVAALLIFVTLAPNYPGMYRALVLVLAVILAMDFMVMIFNHSIIRVPGLLPALQVLGAVLVFLQVALAVDTMLVALRTIEVGGGG